MTLLRVSKLSKYFGGLAAVQDLDLFAEKGEIVGLIGPNGAGKTTVFNLISGYLTPTGGEIAFKGESLAGLKPNRVCKKGIGRTFQIVQPFAGLTVLKNVMISALNRTEKPKIAEEKSLDILQFLGLSEKRNFPVGSLTIADRKRLELAKALATEPELMLLDEVAAGLNPRETEDIIGMIKQINKRGIGLLMIEHVMKAIVSLASRIVVINFGIKIAEGAPSEVLRHPEVVKAYLGGDIKVAEHK
jgi:branched-chain amino acid transport system ATP-binding protein